MVFRRMKNEHHIVPTVLAIIFTAVVADLDGVGVYVFIVIVAEDIAVEGLEFIVVVASDIHCSFLLFFEVFFLSLSVLII